MAFCLSSLESLSSNLAPRQIRALRGQSRLHNEFWTQRFFLRVCPLPLGSCDSLAGRTPLKGFFHKSFNTSCHSSPLMTRRVNFTSAKTVTHRMAMPMLKPKKISMMGIIRLWYRNADTRAIPTNSVKRRTFRAHACLFRQPDTRRVDQVIPVSCPRNKHNFRCDQNGPPARREEGAYLN